MIVICLIVLGLIPGCGRLVGGPELGVFRIPWPDVNGKYVLQDIAISSFDQPSSLQGRFAKLLVDPFIVDGQIASATAIGHYIRNQDDVSVPSDFVSLQAAVIHAHYERIAAVDVDAGMQIQWPARIGIQANLLDKGGALHNNAIYDGKLDALLIVPYSERDIPIAINGGILAHEHFHMIFQSLVLNHLGKTGHLNDKAGLLKGACDWQAQLTTIDRGSPENSLGKPSKEPPGDIIASRHSDKDKVKVYNSFVLRAINEGLADFWGWLYTGDANFISASLPSEKERRSLDSKAVAQMPGKSQMSGWVTGIEGKALTDSQLVANAYSVGTAYSRLLYELSAAVVGEKKPTDSGKKTVAQALIKALNRFAKGAEVAEKEGAMISPNFILTEILKELPEAGGRPCQVIKRVTSGEWDGDISAIQCEKNSTPQALSTPSTNPSAATAKATPILKEVSTQ